MIPVPISLYTQPCYNPGAVTSFAHAVHPGFAEVKAKAKVKVKGSIGSCNWPIVVLWPSAARRRCFEGFLLPNQVNHSQRPHIPWARYSGWWSRTS